MAVIYTIPPPHFNIKNTDNDTKLSPPTFEHYGIEATTRRGVSYKIPFTQVQKARQYGYTGMRFWKTRTKALKYWLNFDESQRTNVTRFNYT